MTRFPEGGLAPGLGPDDELRTVPADQWLTEIGAAIDQGYDWFDSLHAVDELGRDDVFTVVCRLVRWQGSTPTGRQLSTTVPRDQPRLDTLSGLIAGASWHEREAHDMFGIEFVGGDQSPLLWHQSDDVEPLRPLRKDAVLAARTAQPWPGTKDPSDAGRAGSAAASRRRMAPAGVPDADVWGDRALGDRPDPAEVAQALSGGRVRRRR